MILEQTGSGILETEGPHAGEWRISAEVFLTPAELEAFDQWPTYADVADADRRHEPCPRACWCGRLHNAFWCERLNRLERRTTPARPLQPSPPDGELLAHIAIDHESLRRVWGLAHRWAEQAMLSEDPNGVLASATRLHAEMVGTAVTGQPSEPRQLGSLLAGLAAARMTGEAREALRAGSRFPDDPPPAGALEAAVRRCWAVADLLAADAEALPPGAGHAGTMRAAEAIWSAVRATAPPALVAELIRG